MFRNIYTPLEHLLVQMNTKDKALVSLNQTNQLKESLKVSNISSKIIDHISNVNFSEIDLRDGDSIVWFGGEGSFDLYDVNFDILHKSYILHYEDTFTCNATRKGNLLEFDTLGDIIINEFNLTLEDVLLIYQHLAYNWNGGDTLSRFEILEQIFLL